MEKLLEPRLRMLRLKLYVAKYNNISALRIMDRYRYAKVVERLINDYVKC
jgi:hypothetical protein